MNGGPLSASGTIEFIWDAGDQMLLTIEPDDPVQPHTFELGGDLRERYGAALAEGDRVQVEFVSVEHEIVDPDLGPSETLRAQVLSVRVLGD